MDLNNYPRITYSEAHAIMRLAVTKTRRSLALLGVPGIGKSQLPAKIGRENGIEVVYFDLGNGAREDAIMPVKLEIDGKPCLVQIPLDALRIACERGVILVIDEITRCDRNKQAIAMMLCHDRRIGSYRLHPDTTVIMLGNGIESAGTTSLNDALINRLAVFNLVPTRADVLAMLTTLGDDDTTKRRLLAKVSGIAEIRPELVQITPPDGAQESCAQWASPRAWEAGAEELGAWLDSGLPLDEVALKILSARIGSAPAAAFFAVLANEGKLPTPAEIMADPKGCKLPPDVESAIAAIGLLKEVAQKDRAAAWLYLARFDGALKEMQAAGARSLLSAPPTTNPEAMKAFSALVGRVNASAARARS